MKQVNLSYPADSDARLSIPREARLYVRPKFHNTALEDFLAAGLYIYSLKEVWDENS